MVLRSKLLPRCSLFLFSFHKCVPHLFTFMFFLNYYNLVKLFCLLFLFLLLHFVVLCFTVYQIEMAIETLQKSEGLSSQRSSLLNSHVSCFSRVLAFASLLTLPNSLYCLSSAPALLVSISLSFSSLPLTCFSCNF